MLLPLFLFPRSLIAQNITRLSEETQFIMQTQTEEGTSLKDAMFIHQVGSRWFIPLGDFSESVGFGIRISTTLGKADGFIVNESRRFSLEIETCQVVIQDSIKNFPCELVVVYQNEIYIEQGLLESWLPVKFRIDPFGSKLIVKALENLPEIDRLNRQKISPATNIRTDIKSDYPITLIPHNVLDGPFIDQQIGITTQKTENTTTSTGQYSTMLSGEFLGLETLGTFSGNSEKLNPSTLTFARKDPEGNLLGPLGARKIEFFDIQFPTLELISEGRSGKGIEVSNIPLFAPTNISTHHFAGTLPPGWEVELYQNSVLLSRQITGQDGKYEIKDVNLMYGLNDFKFIYYGPQGQRREEHKVLDIRSTQLKPGQKNYRVSYVKTAERENRVLTEFRQGLSENVSFQGAFAHLMPNKEVLENKNYGLLGINSYFDNIFISSSLATVEWGGYAASIGSQFYFDHLSLGLTQTELQNFESDVFKSQGQSLQIRQTKMSLSANVLEWPPLRLVVDGTRNEFEDSTINQDIISQKTALNMGSINWFNELTWQATAGVERSFSGSLIAMRDFTKSNLKMIGGYDKEHFTDLGLETQVNTIPYRYNFGVKENFDTKVVNYGIGAGRMFKFFQLNWENNFASTGDFSINLSLSFGMLRESQPQAWHVLPQAQALTGAASVLAYVDRNNSNNFDEEDTVIPGAHLQINNSPTGIKTDESGRAFIPGLAAYRLNNLNVALSSIEDPFLRPSISGVSFTPRPGKTVYIELPYIVTGEVDGTVQWPESMKNRPSEVIVELFLQTGQLIKSIKTERDGFYSFDGLPQGDYFLKISAQQLEELKLRAFPANLRITVPKEGLSEGGQNFKLIPL